MSPNSHTQTNILEHDPLTLSGSSPQRLGVLSTPASGHAGSPRTYDCSQNLQSDGLIGAYYANFHKFHPIIFPQHRLMTFCQDPSWRPRLEPLLAVLRLIGNIYSSKEWSIHLQDSIEACLAQTSSTDPVTVQARLLYSAALFWQDRKDAALREVAAAAEIAMELGMYRREYATDNSAGDAVVAESWRRTWWMVFILDGFYAGTLGTREYNVLHVEATVELPCEESEYESGVR